MKATSQTLDQKSSVSPERDSARRASAVLDTSEQAADGFLTRPQIAERLNVSLRTVDRWIARGFLPFYKVGSCVLFDWDDVSAHLRKHFRFSPGGDL